MKLVNDFNGSHAQVALNVKIPLAQYVFWSAKNMHTYYVLKIKLFQQ